MANILLVDDDIVLLERIATELSEAGHTVLRTSHVQHAELLLAEQRPDLVVLDPDIGSGDGWLLIGQAAPHAAVILVSGQALEEDVVRGLDAGAVDFLAKPYRTAELLARIRTRMRERAQLTSQLPAPNTTPLAQPATGATLRFDRAPTAPGRDRHGALAPGDAAEPVFMSYGEEELLFRDTRATHEEDPGDVTVLPLGQRLHAARTRKRITLVQAELETRPAVPMHYIQAMEEEKFSLLPRGAIAEEMLRSYAGFLGLNVAQALDEYRRLHFNAPVAPPAALGGSPLPRRLPGWTIWLTAVVLALVVGVGGIWLYDPRSLTGLAQRARLVVAPPTATATSTVTPSPTATATPTVTPSPTATATPTVTPSPTDTPSPTLTPSATPRRR